MLLLGANLLVKVVGAAMLANFKAKLAKIRIT